MAPTSYPKCTNDAEARKPVALAPVAKHALQKNTHSQRSSLRRAVRESLLDLSAVATVTTPPPSSRALFLPSPSSAPSTSTSRVSTATQRSSLRRALKESLRDVAAISTVATITTTPPPTLSPPPLITPKFKSSAPSSLYSLENTPETPVSHSSISPLNSTARSSPDSTSTPTPTFLSPLQSNRKSTILQEQHLGRLGRKLECLDTKESDGPGHTGTDNGDEQSEHPEVVDKTDINGIPTSRKGWYRVQSIIAEAHDRSGHLIYFVDWESHDSRTGIGWPGSWVNSKNVSKAAIREWQDKRIK
ncbi:hypothetical protein F4813DRAFT_370567 [Daldinia decipiens]|uniref:uncharacterized protein n=1 Tax=Daldinia decipiens TaxID=326647 RepID=UPI0020C42192|nr:uncharacterized protein F4813DRAFT_370567 [Daldinia decipiens]KAI1654618.1 hypothetical protein F4813DRAFT_370567 [Daldinia decipiens]